MDSENEPILMQFPHGRYAVLEFVTVGNDYTAFLSGSVKGGGRLSDCFSYAHQLMSFDVSDCKNLSADEAFSIGNGYIPVVMNS